MKLLIILLITCSQAQAVDFGKVITQMKKEMNNLLKGEGQDKDKDEFSIPTIPRVDQDAKSMKVYDKSGKIFSQGESFNKLSLEEKRRYRVAFLTELYLKVRGSEIKTQELQSGINMLEQGGTREGVYRSLVLGNDYRTLEAFQDSPSDALLDWTLKYSETFLGLVYKRNQLSQLNMWGIKRVIVEKTLEVMDAFPSDGENLFRWYAHISKGLALEKKGGLSGKVRTNPSLGFHYRWATKVPIQQVKSELIIKLHSVMTQLN